MVGADRPLQSEATVHSTEAVKVPVPSAMTGAKLVNPERPPAGVVGELAMVVIVEAAMLSLNRKSSPPPAPVSTNLFPLISDTLKLTLAPACVSVTEPNPGAGMLPPSHVEPEIWHDVKLNVSARLTLGNAALAASNAATAKVARPDQLFMRTSIFSGSRNPRKAVYILKKKHCQSSNNFLDSFSNLPKLRFLDLIVLSFSNLPKLRF